VLSDRFRERLGEVERQLAEVAEQVAAAEVSRLTRAQQQLEGGVPKPGFWVQQDEAWAAVHRAWMAVEDRWHLRRDTEQPVPDTWEQLYEQVVAFERAVRRVAGVDDQVLAEFTMLRMRYAARDRALAALDEPAAEQQIAWMLDEGLPAVRAALGSYHASCR
jgi:hypothetical protein